MITKSYDLNKININNFTYFLLYGPNTGLIEETVEKVFKTVLSKNIITFDETELINHIEAFKEMIFNKSFFEDEKLIIINRASNKILDIIEELSNTEITDIKIIIKTGSLEKKSKLRNYFEKHKSAVITAFYEDSYQSLSLMVQKIFKEKNIKVSNEIINLIVERSKGNRININNEMEKILSFAKNNKISLDNVLKLTNLAENYSISELVNQNLSKNKKKTINILNENNLNTEDNILIIKTFLNKLKKLKKLKLELDKNKNIEQVLSSSKPPIFWKDKTIIKHQLDKWSINEIKSLIYKVNNIELSIKKNNLISDKILKNFILDNLILTNNAI